MMLVKIYAGTMLLATVAHAMDEMFEMYDPAVAKAAKKKRLEAADAEERAKAERINEIQGATSIPQLVHLANCSEILGNILFKKADHGNAWDSQYPNSLTWERQSRWRGWSALLKRGGKMFGKRKLDLSLVGCNIEFDPGPQKGLMFEIQPNLPGGASGGTKWHVAPMSDEAWHFLEKFFKLRDLQKNPHYIPGHYSQKLNTAKTAFLACEELQACLDKIRRKRPTRRRRMLEPP